MQKLFFSFILLLATNILAMDESAQKQSWDGEQYQKNSSGQVKFALAQLQGLDIASGKFKDICDMGCGPGDITAAIARMSLSSLVIGYDPAEKQIQKAIERFSGIDNLYFDQKAADTLDKEDSFDLYVSFSAWHWVANQNEAIERAAKSLRNGGTLFISMLGKTAKEDSIEKAYDTPIMRSIIKTALSERWCQHLADADWNKEVFPLHPDEIQEMMEAVGLNAQSVKCIAIKVPYANIDLLKGAFKGFLVGCPSLAGLGKLYDSFVDDLMAVYLEEVPANEDGSIVYDVQVLTALGVKPE